MKAPLCLVLCLMLAAPALGDTIINFDDLPLVPANAGTYGNIVPLPGSNGFFGARTYDGFVWTNVGYFTSSTSPFVGVTSSPNAGVIVNVVPTVELPNGRLFNFVSAYITYADPTGVEEPQPGPGAALLVGGLDSHGNILDLETINPTLTPTLYTFNFRNIAELAFNTQWFTALDDLDFTLAGTAFSLTPGLTANQRGIASSIDSASFGAGSSGLSNVINALSSLPTTEVGGALDELSPAKFARFASTTAFNNEAFEATYMDSYLAGLRGGAQGGFAAGNGRLDTSGFVVNDPNIDPGLQMIHSRMLAWNDLPQTLSDVPGALLGGVDMKDMKQMKPVAAESPWDVFLRGNVILAQGFSQADQPHFDDNSESVVVGADYHFTPHFLAGLTASYAHTDATLDTANSSATVDSYSPGLYASYADGGWYGNFIGRYSFNSYTQSRAISFLGQTADSGTDGNEGSVDLDGGYDFHSGPWTYGPVAGVQYTHLTVNSYTEQNSAAALAVNEDPSDSLRSRLGGNVRFDFRGFGVAFTPHLTATWQHEFLDGSRGLTSQFTQFSGGSFNVRTPGTSDDSALVDLGLDAKVDDTLTVFADYLVQAGQSDYFGQSVQAGVRVSF